MEKYINKRNIVDVSFNTTHQRFEYEGGVDHRTYLINISMLIIFIVRI